MANKVQFIRELADSTVKAVTSTPSDWMDYLDTASRVYKYSFSDQLLIHAQRPEATACAPLELWNARFDRWINRGTKGIALLDDKSEALRLRYVFDVADTHKGRRGRDPYLWQLTEE